MKWILSLLLISMLSCCMMSGCYGVASITRAISKREMSITVGKTTKTDILAGLGTPDDEGQGSPDSSFVYRCFGSTDFTDYNVKVFQTDSSWKLMECRHFGNIIILFENDIVTDVSR